MEECLPIRLRQAALMGCDARIPRGMNEGVKKLESIDVCTVQQYPKRDVSGKSINPEIET